MILSDDDVSKVTLPACHGHGYGRHWLSSALLVKIVSCPYSDVFGFLYDSDLCIVSIWILARWSRCCIYVLLGSIVNYCDVTICDQIHPHCVYVLRARDVWWASSNRFYAEFGGNR